MSIKAEVCGNEGGHQKKKKSKANIEAILKQNKKEVKQLRSQREAKDYKLKKNKKREQQQQLKQRVTAIGKTKRRLKKPRAHKRQRSQTT